MSADAAKSLAALGFSELEAGVYVALLARPDRTGYAVAQELGKATANTYKAIESLVRKGALMDDGGDPRGFRAVPADELIGRLRADFGARASDAARALERLGGDGPDDRVYHLQGDVSQVYARARSLIDGAARLIVADLFPTPLAELMDALLAAEARGVAVFVRAYAREPVCEPVRGPAGIMASEEPRVLSSWPGDHIGVVADAQVHLFALLGRQPPRVLQAIWSASPYLSCLAYNHVAMEWRVAATRSGLSEADGPPQLAGGDVPGFGRLQALCAGQQLRVTPRGQAAGKAP